MRLSFLRERRAIHRRWPWWTLINFCVFIDKLQQSQGPEVGLAEFQVFYKI